MKYSFIKKVYLILLTLILTLNLVGCQSWKPFDAPEQPHLYWKTINVEVTEVNHEAHWFSIMHRYQMSLTVKSEEYGLEKTFNIYSQGVKPEGWDYKEGDIIEAELYTWKMDSTGEIIKREINKIL